jgi:hypothetical protein
MVDATARIVVETTTAKALSARAATLIERRERGTVASLPERDGHGNRVSSERTGL